MRSRRPVRRPTSTNSSRVEAVMKPRPPSWMRTRMTTCPKAVQWVPVSRTTRPVTQTADVAVKKASRRGVTWPSVAANGSISSSVPMAMRSAKPRTSTSAGEGGRRTRLGGATWYSWGFSRPTRTRRSPGFWPGRMGPAVPRPPDVTTTWSGSQGGCDPGGSDGSVDASTSSSIALRMAAGPMHVAALRADVAPAAQVPGSALGRTG